MRIKLAPESTASRLTRGKAAAKRTGAAVGRSNAGSGVPHVRKTPRCALAFSVSPHHAFSISPFHRLFRLGAGARGCFNRRDKGCQWRSPPQC
jgi:hypothetical protein